MMTKTTAMGTKEATDGTKDIWEDNAAMYYIMTGDHNTTRATPDPQPEEEGNPSHREASKQLPLGPQVRHTVQESIRRL